MGCIREQGQRTGPDPPCYFGRQGYGRKEDGYPETSGNTGVEVLVSSHRGILFGTICFNFSSARFLLVRPHPFQVLPDPAGIGTNITFSHPRYGTDVHHGTVTGRNDADDDVIGKAEPEGGISGLDPALSRLGCNDPPTHCPSCRQGSIIGQA